MSGGASDPKTAADGPSALACIEVRRNRGRAVGVWRRFAIHVDGEEAGAVGFGRTLRLCVAPGRHRVRARLDHGGSPEVDVEVGPGETAVLQLEPSRRGWRATTAWIEFIARPGRMLALRRIAPG